MVLLPSWFDAEIRVVTPVFVLFELKMNVLKWTQAGFFWGVLFGVCHGNLFFSLVLLSIDTIIHLNGWCAILKGMWTSGAMLWDGARDRQRQQTQNTAWSTKCSNQWDVSQSARVAPCNLSYYFVTTPLLNEVITAKVANLFNRAQIMHSWPFGREIVWRQMRCRQNLDLTAT